MQAAVLTPLQALHTMLGKAPSHGEQLPGHCGSADQAGGLSWGLWLSGFVALAKWLCRSCSDCQARSVPTHAAQLRHYF